MVNDKDNRVFLSPNYWSDSCPWKFDVLKTSIFASKLRFSGKYFKNIKFPRGNYQPIVAPRKFDVIKTNICPRSEDAIF